LKKYRAFSRGIQMKKISVMMLAGLTMVLLFGCNPKPKTSCIYGDQIPANVLDQVVPLGDKLAMDLEQGKFDDIYASAGDLFRKVQTPEQFKMVLGAMSANLGTLEFSKLTEAYYLKNKAGKKYPTVSVPCSLEVEGAKNINDIYEVPANTEIVSLIYRSKTGNDNAGVFIELIKEGTQWKLISIVLSPTTYKGKNVDDYVNLARKAREAGKLRLAILYYKFAYLLSDLSPNVDEFVSRKVTEEMGQVKADYIPTGTPQVWTVDAETKPEVFNVDVIIDKNEPWVNIEWLTPDFNDTARVEAISGKLLDYAFQSFPEYREFFTGIVVSARSQDPKLATQAYRKLRRFSEVPLAPPKPEKK